MKRLNGILIAGTLCFSLGYIANDVVGELGVELSTPAFASPIYSGPRTSHTTDEAREESGGRQILKVDHVERGLQAYQVQGECFDNQDGMELMNKILKSMKTYRTRANFKLWRQAESNIRKYIEYETRQKVHLGCKWE